MKPLPLLWHIHLVKYYYIILYSFYNFTSGTIQRTTTLYGRSHHLSSTELYDRYSASLYGVILRIVKDESAAEEVMQDCFVKIWYSFPQYNSDKGRLFTWLATISRHVAIDKIRSLSYRQVRLNQNLDILYNNSNFEINFFKPEHIGIKELLIALSADQRKVVNLLYFEGHSHLDVSTKKSINKRAENITCFSNLYVCQ